MSAPSLLADVIENIIDYLADNRASLIACSLAGRECVRPTRRHLFKSQHVDGPYKCSRLQAFLEKFPHLAKYVRLLQISRENTLCPRPRNPSQRQASGAEWMDSLPFVLNSLYRLQELQFVRMHWSDLCSQPSQLGLIYPHLQRVSRLFIYTVHFQTYTDLQRILGCASRATEIIIADVRCTANYFAKESRAQHSSRTEGEAMLQVLSLDVDRAPCILDLYHGRTATLRKVVLLNIRYADMAQVKQLLQTCGSSLQELELDFGNWCSGTCALPSANTASHETTNTYVRCSTDIELDLSHNINLESLRIHGIKLPICSDFVSHWFGKNDFSRLHTIYFELIVHKAEAFAGFEWSALEKALVVGRYPSLQRLVFHLSSPYGSERDLMRNIMQGRLAGLRATRADLVISVLPAWG